MRFRRRSDLHRFAQQYPGALGALFLMQVRCKLQAGEVSKSSDLYRTDPTLWATTLSGLKEARDLREVLLLSRVICELNKDRLPQAVDIIAQRIREVLAAKKTGGSWDKGSLLSLMASDSASMSAAMPDGALDL